MKTMSNAQSLQASGTPTVGLNILYEMNFLLSYFQDKYGPYYMVALLYFNLRICKLETKL